MKNNAKVKLKKSVINRLPLTMKEVDYNVGLTDEQVRERVDKGHVNKVKISTSKSGWQIFASNFFNVFNILCFLVLIWILSVATSFGDLKDCFFILIISANILVGIIQEFRAKHIIDKMSLTSSPKSKVLRNGEFVELNADKLVRDDIIEFGAGEEISADSVIVSGKLYVNESMLTGETNSIEKNVGDLILAGSYVVSGSAKAIVKNIAEENYIQSLAKEAKKFKTAKSVLMTHLFKLLKILSIIVVVFAVPSFINNFNASLIDAMETSGITTYSNGFWNAIFNFGKVKGLISGAALDLAYKSAVRSTATVLIGMIPAGMMLLTSVTLAIGVIKIAKHKAMVQGLYSIETLARVNLMCLDKTGTLTDGSMKVINYKNVSKKYKDDELFTIISSAENELDDNNATAIALKEYFNKAGNYKVKSKQNFDSDKKYSKVEFEKIGSIYVGAPEFVCDLHENNQKVVTNYQKEGYRVLLIAQELDGKKEPLAIITLEDNIKPTAKQTIEYFKKNKVDLRVISGDNPITVAHIAKVVGIEGCENYVSAQGLTDEQLLEKAKTCVVFGRVNPEQKKLLIKFYKECGHTVAMTGDGINDILALKEADCAIAMANGADATKSVAHIVLMDSDFKSMPHVVVEGRQVINNVERSSAIFLTKTLTMFLLQVLYIILQKAVPIAPVNLSYIDILCVGIPAFFVALEPNTKKLEGNFFVNVLKKILPCALTIFVSILTLSILHENGVLKVTDGQFTTLVVLAMYFVFTLLLIDVCHPFNIRKAIICIVAALIGIVYFGIILNVCPNTSAINIFSMSNINTSACLISILLTLAWSVLGLFIAKMLIKYWNNIIKFFKKLKPIKNNKK